MFGLLNALPGGISQGLMWAVLALGVYVTYKILDFADLTVDGSLATGGCVAIVLTAAEVHPIIALLVATLAGAIAGVVTALLNTKLKIPAILSGILTMSALYSINKIILGGRANVAASQKLTIVGRIAGLLNMSSSGLDRNLITIGVCVIAIVGIIAFLYWFFGTEWGSAIRATGNNPTMATAQGINTDKAKIIALAMSNGLAALSGAIISQYQFSADVNMASGTIVIGLASVVIGQLVVGDKGSFWVRLLGVVIGSLIYRLIFALAVQLGLNPDNLKLISSIIIVIALCLPTIKQKFFSKTNLGGTKE